jgi:hypothetical protein
MAEAKVWSRKGWGNVSEGKWEVGRARVRGKTGVWRERGKGKGWMGMKM